jgi:hypothetical protein
MRKTALFILGTMLMAGSMAQVATAAEQTRKTDERAAVAQDPHYRGAYDQSNGSSQAAPLNAEEKRNKEDFGFSGRSPSRPGGENPNLNPSD